MATEGPNRAQRGSGVARLPFIDGLRGIAASAVVFYHLAANVSLGSAAFADSRLAHVAHYGFLGVYVFFVISGFVITLSVGNGPVNGSFFWRYALRRSIRLDPPYWISMIVAVSLAMVAQVVVPSLQKHLPDAAVVVAHLFYLQNFLRMDNIVAVYWTLCFEIQFYLVLLLLLWIAQSRARERTVAAAISTPAFLVLGAALLAYSLGQLAGLWQPAVAGLFTHSWYAFCVGASCFITIQFGWSRLAALGVAAAVLAISVFAGSAAGYATVLTAATIYLVIKRGFADRWLAGPVAQYFGRISYSLYLLHPTIGWTTVSVLKKLFGDATGMTKGVVYIIAGFATSIVAAHLAYLLIEKPSIRLSHRIRLRKQATVLAPQAVTP